MAEWKPETRYEAFPGVLNGGIIGALLDCHCNWTAAWYLMNKWLQDFAYRISMGWWIFFIAGASAMVISLVTVSFQAIKAAIANPVKALRSE